MPANFCSVFVINIIKLPVSLSSGKIMNSKTYSIVIIQRSNLPGTACCLVSTQRLQCNAHYSESQGVLRGIRVGDIRIGFRSE